MRKTNISELQEYAKSRGGQLISTVYRGQKQRLTWMCSEGHQWVTAWTTIKNQGSWCPICIGHVSASISELQIYAKHKGGRLVSTTYSNCDEKLEWECSKGHQWSASWYQVKKRKTWCSRCAGRKPDISDVQAYAKSKGGRLISTTYKGAGRPLLWECSKGHQWWNTWSSVKSQNSWCRICAGCAKAGISEPQAWAKSKGGRLISTTYRDKESKLKWECSKGHRWVAAWGHIKNRNGWCPKCAGKAKPDISELQEYARNKKGRLVSTTYSNGRVKLEWECAKGHQWSASWESVKNAKSWCPECASFKTERECRKLLQDKLGITLKKHKFKDEGQILEWDGYSKEHNIAFEYQGYQHFDFPNFFHKTREAFDSACQRDRQKVEYAKTHRIRLIIIPPTRFDQLEAQIDKCIQGSMG